MPPSTNLRTANGAVSVALIDGVPLVREGLSALVHRTPGLRWVGAAENPSVGVRMCERLRPDVVVVDAALDPRGQLSRLLAGGHGVVLMIDEPQLTTQYVTNAVTGGVRGVIRRAAQPAQLVQAIQSVHTDGRYMDATLAAELGGAPTAAPGERSAPAAVAARARGAAADRRRAREPGHRERPVRVRRDHPDPREEHPAQARVAGPHPRGGRRVPVRCAHHRRGRARLTAEQ